MQPRPKWNPATCWAELYVTTAPLERSLIHNLRLSTTNYLPRFNLLAKAGTVGRCLERKSIWKQKKKKKKNVTSADGLWQMRQSFIYLSRFRMHSHSLQMGCVHFLTDSPSVRVSAGHCFGKKNPSVKRGFVNMSHSSLLFLSNLRRSFSRCTTMFFVTSQNIFNYVPNTWDISICWRKKKTWWWNMIKWNFYESNASLTEAVILTLKHHKLSNTQNLSQESSQLFSKLSKHSIHNWFWRKKNGRWKERQFHCNNFLTVLNNL